MANIDERYKRGKIYTIRCRYDDTLIYVGSTIDKLAKRMHSHHKDKTCSLYQFVNGDWINWYIELYEDYPCDNKEQLERREGQVQREIATINRYIAGRSKKEWYEDNRDTLTEYHKQHYQDNRDTYLERARQYRQDNLDEILEYHKQYYQDNRDTLLEYHKQHYQDNRDTYLEKMRQYRQDNRDTILEKLKQHYRDNRDKRLEYHKQYYQDNRNKILEKCKCDVCGAEVLKSGIKRHQKSAKCMSANK